MPTKAVKRLLASQKAEIAARVMAGESKKNLAKEYGCSVTSIASYCRTWNARQELIGRIPIDEIGPFEMRAADVLSRVSNEGARNFLQEWREQITHYKSPTGGGCKHEQAVVLASKQFPDLYSLFKEFDVSEFDLAQTQKPPKRRKVVNEGRDLTHRENMAWAMSAAGEQLRTGSKPKSCPNNAAWFLYKQALDNPKEFLAKVNQVEARVHTASEDESESRKEDKRSVAELEAMLKDIVYDGGVL